MSYPYGASVPSEFRTAQYGREITSHEHLAVTPQHHSRSWRYPWIKTCRLVNSTASIIFSPPSFFTDVFIEQADVTSKSANAIV